MKLIKTAPKQTKTFKVGDEIVVTEPYFDGRVTEFVKTLMTVTKVNRVTLIAEDKKGNVYQLDTRYDNIIARADYNEFWYNYNIMNRPQQYTRPATAQHQQRLNEFMDKLNALRADYPEMYISTADDEVEVSILDNGKFVEGVYADIDSEYR